MKEKPKGVTGWTLETLDLTSCAQKSPGHGMKLNGSPNPKYLDL